MTPSQNPLDGFRAELGAPDPDAEARVRVRATTATDHRHIGWRAAWVGVAASFVLVVVAIAALGGRSAEVQVGPATLPDGTTSIVVPTLAELAERAARAPSIDLPLDRVLHLRTEHGDAVARVGATMYFSRRFEDLWIEADGGRWRSTTSAARNDETGGSDGPGSTSDETTGALDAPTWIPVPDYASLPRDPSALAGELAPRFGRIRSDLAEPVVDLLAAGVVPADLRRPLVLLFGESGYTVVGTATDGTGRPGIALESERSQTTGYRRIILDPVTARPLGLNHHTVLGDVDTVMSWVVFGEPEVVDAIGATAPN